VVDRIDEETAPVTARLKATAFRLIFGVMVLLAASGALACSTEDRIELAQMGFTSGQLDTMCGSGGSPFVTPSLPDPTVCVTRYGNCGLANRVRAGNQCGCPIGGGWTLGVTR
jgi:hypothetical protein